MGSDDPGNDPGRPENEGSDDPEASDVNDDDDDDDSDDSAQSVDTDTSDNSRHTMARSKPKPILKPPPSDREVAAWAAEA